MSDISKKHLKKHKDIIDVMRKLRFDDYEISLKLEEMEELEGWSPITFLELKSMSEKQLGKLMSYCWHDGNPRCNIVGITDVIFKPSGYGKDKWNIYWSDGNGDPRLEGYELNELIDNLGDGEWNYGLYKKDK